MTRNILGRSRTTNANGELETWVEWIQRVTEEAREKMEQFKIPSWSAEVRLRILRWRDRVSNMSHERWTRKVYDWEPSGFRLRGRPLARWADQFQSQLSPVGM
eukprot:9858508-Karenia_brevis.AAC.1